MQREPFIGHQGAICTRPLAGILQALTTTATVIRAGRLVVARVITLLPAFGGAIGQQWDLIQRLLAKHATFYIETRHEVRKYLNLIQ